MIELKIDFKISNLLKHNSFDLRIIAYLETIKLSFKNQFF
jgi:hypothetical protein